jgi:hypothetical protein
MATPKKTAAADKGFWVNQWNRAGMWLMLLLSFERLVQGGLPCTKDFGVEAAETGESDAQEGIGMREG